MILLRLKAALGILLVTLGLTVGAKDRYFRYGNAFEEFIGNSGYKGGATGILLGDRLGYAAGYGETITGHGVTAESLFPASGLSKSLTAVTILQLIEEGLLHPQEKVFGENGKLSDLLPKRNLIADARLLDISIDDLLRHAAGWDAEISPMADPVFNEFLVEGNHRIVDIRKELNTTDLTVYDIIRFMATKPLDFTPGTMSTFSNLGYIILGRVIEEVLMVPYDVAVKDKVLTPCGMWHTRLGPRMREGQNVFKSRSPRDIKAELREKHEIIGEYYAYVQTYLVDSCLGWFTNVYDSMRFAQCLDGSAGYSLLNETTIKYMTSRSKKQQNEGSNYFAVGFMAHENGAIWVGEEPHAPDVVYLHRNLRRHKQGDVYTGDENVPMAWVHLFEGKPTIDPPLKQLSRAMVEAERNWPTSDAFSDDIQDKLVTLGETTKLIKIKIDEHHANSYLTALKRAQFNVIWINAYTHDRHTYITVIAERDPKASRECVALAGLGREKLVERKLELQKEGYNMTFFQNYKSFSHNDQYMFLAVFHKGAFRNDSHTLYGIQHFDRPYKTLLELYEEKGYHPLVQSIEYRRDDALLSFILEADTSHEKDQKSIYSSEENLSEQKLKKCVQKYARQQRRLIYLDASNHRGKPKFSALFKKSRMTKWLFSQSLSEEDILRMIQEKEDEGFLPSIIVGYSTKDGFLQFSTYMEKP